MISFLNNVFMEIHDLDYNASAHINHRRRHRLTAMPDEPLAVAPEQSPVMLVQLTGAALGAGAAAWPSPSI